MVEESCSGPNLGGEGDFGGGGVREGGSGGGRGGVGNSHLNQAF